jgi:pseudo-rSAM protein
MKHTSQSKAASCLYLEPYAISQVCGNDSLVYNSISGEILEYRDNELIAATIRKMEDQETGFLAEITENQNPGIPEDFIKDLRNGFSGDLIRCQDSKPAVIRPKPIIKQYPPPRDFPSFSADDYLRSICFFVNGDDSPLTREYKLASRQFPCMLHSPEGYREISTGLIRSVLEPYSGVSGMILEFGGSDITRYSEVLTLARELKSFSLPVTIHIALPCRNPGILSELAALPRIRISFYVTAPEGLEQLKRLIEENVIRQKGKKTEVNFIIRSMEEYSLAGSFLEANSFGRFFFLPYFDGQNMDFFKENVFLSREDILGLKPSLKQVYSRQLINEQLYGKIFITPVGQAFANMNSEPIGDITTQSLSDVVRNELERSGPWHLTRMKVNPCSDCLYQIFCPPIGNYELLLDRFNFCDVI